MSDTENEKDVTCFTVDGVVAEMVIEVEEGQRTGCDDLTNSPLKDNSCYKNNDPVRDSIDAVDKEEKKQKIVESSTDKQDKENSLEIIEEVQKSPEPVEDKKSERKTDCVVKNKKDNEINEYVVEDKKYDESDECVVLKDEKCDESNESVVEDKKPDEINQITEEKMCDEINDQDVGDLESKEIKKQSIKNNQTAKQKRKKIELDFHGNEKDSKDTLMSRYPDVKKRKTELNSKEEKETSNGIIIKKSLKNEEQTSNIVKESATSKESEKTILSRSLRNRKTGSEKSDKKEAENEKSDKKEAENEKSDKKEAESEKSDKKQKVLRKLPCRQNNDAPEVPDLKPKVFWWNGVGEGEGIKLGDIPEIRGRIQKAKSIRALYRIIYFQWPTNGQDIIEEILKFNGFPFDKTSFEYTKRQSLMKIMLDKTIFHLCELLDIRKGDKVTCIKNILDFLLKPCAKIDPATDPFWQPVVNLEKIELDKYFNESSKKKDPKLRRGRSLNSTKNSKEKDTKSSAISPRSKRNSGPRNIELIVIPEPEKTTEKQKEDMKQSKTKLSVSKEANRSVGKSSVKGNTTPVKESKVNTSQEKKKVTTASGMTKTKPSLGKDEKSKTTSVKETKETTVSNNKATKLSPKELKSKTEETKINVSDKLTKKKKFNKRRKKINSTSNKKLPEKQEMSDIQTKDDSDEYEIEMTIDSGPDMDEDTEMKDTDTKKLESEPLKVDPKKSETQSVEISKENSNAAVPMLILSDSSETESAEETKLVTASKKSSKVPMKRKGKPLRHFPKIIDSVKKANFSALQRLHILLFGTSDKAENLKTNILSFGGFPFLEGSDEWKQKHFLLSLLAQNNLQEYLNLLSIPCENDDQPTMISKLMRFLAVPSEESLEFSQIQPIETEVISSVLVDKSSPIISAPKGEPKKKVKKKKEEEKVSKRPRKILMSEEEARRLEANFAREQRALARERKLVPFSPIPQPLLPATPPALNLHNYVTPPKSQPPITDPDQLNALLQTVYKRRALKAAGAIISTPNKGQKTKLGDIENIKFLIVTSHLQDLEILHRLIYMLEASKSRIRKNIMDFDGFGFNEDSPKYRHRMDYLNSLGYEASKRISFLLGLCPLNTNIPQNDLNELIMYFLMSPCKSKQTVPITQMPSEEPHIIVKSTVPLKKSKSMYSPNPALSIPIPPSGSSEVSKKSSDDVIIQHSTPIPKTFNQKAQKSSDDVIIQHSTPISKTFNQKAKKSFSSSTKVSPVQKILLPPSQSPVLGVSSLGNKPQKMTLLNSIPALPAYSIPKSTVSTPLTNSTQLNTGGIVLNAPKSPINSLVKVPVTPGTKMQLVNQSQKVNITDPATLKIPVSLSNAPISFSNVSQGQVLQNQILIPQIPSSNNIQPSQVPSALLQGAKMLLKQQPAAISGSPQEFIVQQQTPDGQQKVFKLIRLTSNHPLVSNVGSKPPVQQTVSSPPQQQVLLSTNNPLPGNLPTLPPGLIIMKSNSGLPQLQNLQLLPNAPVKLTPLSSTISSPVSPIVSSSQLKTTIPQTENIQQPNETDSTFPQSENISLDNSIEALSSADDNPPTDEDLFSSIQEVILSSNFEDITLRNVIERVAAQYPNHDLTHRHNYMKECVKKIIMGT